MVKLILLNKSISPPTTNTRFTRRRVVRKLQGHGKPEHPGLQIVLNQADAPLQRTIPTAIEKDSPRLVCAVPNCVALFHSNVHLGGGVWATQFDVAGILYVAQGYVLRMLLLTVSLSRVGLPSIPKISIWFWSVRHLPFAFLVHRPTASSFQRPNVPSSILGATSTSSIDITDFGTPSAAYPSSGCEINEFFTSQQLVIDITLCGTW